MSAENEADHNMCCARCGKPESGNIKLEECDGCDLVKYCSKKCKKSHRKRHSKKCQNRAARLRALFEQPKSTHLGECPICSLPLSIDPNQNVFTDDCCGRVICNGCDYANQKRESEEGLEGRCPCCQKPVPTTHAKREKNKMKRENHPATLYRMGKWYCNNEGHFETGLACLWEAAELGDANAHLDLAKMFAEGVLLEDGRSFVKKDEEKELYHWEQAAIGGHPVARHFLGCKEYHGGRFDRAAKHFTIAASLGYHDSFIGLDILRANGHVSKEDYDAADRAYHAAVDAKKSPEREEAEVFNEAARKLLFTQPNGTHLGDCPICCLPLSAERNNFTSMACCSKLICIECDFRNTRLMFEKKGSRLLEEWLVRRCLHCQTPKAADHEGVHKQMMERIKANDPVTITTMGKQRYDEGDYNGALEYWTKAAELDDAEAHYQLALMYRSGRGVEKDEKKEHAMYITHSVKEVHHLERGAIGGHPLARHDLGNVEWDNDRLQTAAKHFIIASNLGNYASLDSLWKLHKMGYASKTDYDDAVRACQAAEDATKGPEWKEAESCRCASCGIFAAAVDDKLKDCDDCDLVKYCSDVCQRDHRPQHKEECKKRAALSPHDIRLFTQPDTCYGECPICCLPLSLEHSTSMMMTCCSQTICKGCLFATRMRENIVIPFQPQSLKCPFCREPPITTKEKNTKRIMERVNKNCPVAMNQMGKEHYDEGDYNEALEYFTKAAELGDVDAHYRIAGMYCWGKGVKKDEKRYIYHLEEAAVAGHPEARYFLGCAEWNNGMEERAAKHFIIAANHGYKDSLEHLSTLRAEGYVSKEDYDAAIRACQAAVAASKSPEREEGEAFYSAIEKGDGKAVVSLLNAVKERLDNQSPSPRPGSQGKVRKAFKSVNTK